MSNDSKDILLKLLNFDGSLESAKAQRVNCIDMAQYFDDNGMPEFAARERQHAQDWQNTINELLAKKKGGE